jgi:hypothetical protein
MIGASGNCVARTPANLARKKKALEERKLKGKKSAGKKSAGKKKAPTSYPATTSGKYEDPEDFLSALMSIMTCPEGSRWNDDTGKCECDDDHEFNKEMNKCVKRRSFEPLGLPEAKSIEDVFSYVDNCPAEGEYWSTMQNKCVSKCNEGQYWSTTHNKCVSDEPQEDFFI